MVTALIGKAYCLLLDHDATHRKHTAINKSYSALYKPVSNDTEFLAAF